MKLISEHTIKNGTVRHHVEHYRNENAAGSGAALRVIVHRDPYNFQCRAYVEQWTAERGYVTIVTGNGDQVHERRFMADEDLKNIAADMLATYRMMTGATK